MDPLESISEFPEDSLSRDLLYARFRTYAKEKFQTYFKKDNDYLQYIKRSAHLLSLHLPEENSELFINISMAPYFWLCDSLMLTRYEEWLKIEAKGRPPLMEAYRSAKEYFLKWATVRSESEKRYYSLSLNRVVETDTNKNNFLKNLFQAVIYIYDRNLFDPIKALEILNNTGQLINGLKMSEELQDEFYYIIHLYSGFAHIKNLTFQDASMCFAEAIRVKSSGVTAKFYLAYSDKKNGHTESAAILISEIIEYDKAMIRNGIEFNKIGVLSYVLFNAHIYNVFRENEFAEMTDEIDRILEESSEPGGFTFEEVASYLVKLDDLHMKEHYSEEIMGIIAFLDAICQTFMGNNNMLMRYARPYLRTKFIRIAELIIDNISRDTDQKIADRVRLFDLSIGDDMEAIKYLTQEAEGVKVSYKKKLEDAIQNLADRVTAAIAAIEQKIENIQTQKEFDPQTAFNNSMVYNFIITTIVFIIGGFAGCYGDSSGNIYDYKDVMSSIFIYGGKWGAITFLIGVILSAFSAASAFTERMNEKQNLLKKIGLYKNQQERENELIKRDMEKKEQSILENYNERIEEHKVNLGKLQKEKDELLQELKQEKDAEIKVYSDKLNGLFLE